MNLRPVACASLLLFTASQLFAQAALPANAPAKSSAPGQPAAPAAQAEKTPAPGKAAPKAAKTEAKKEEAPKIPGMTIARANGKFLGLEVVGGNFKLSFYDEKKKAVAADMDRGNVRWVITGKADNERAVLNKGGDGKSMTGSKFVKPPYNFKVFLTLVTGEGETAQTESYTVDFRG
jgi:hypothetical protein